jgi:hypothetical protein
MADGVDIARGLLGAADELLHDRSYSVQVSRRSPSEIVARGRVRDEKPPGMYVEGDPDPLTMHDMTVELCVAYPSLEITAVSVEFSTYPQVACPQISDDYSGLVGVSIARGFTHKVRELFGGPRGCTHVTALLQAMAPAVVQSTWSMRILSMRESGTPWPPPRPQSPEGSRGGEAARAAIGSNLDTCHVWAADGELVARVEGGEVIPQVIPVRVRLEARGVEPQE